MTPFSNKNVFRLLNDYTDVMTNACEMFRNSPETYVDAAVLTETITMGTLSMNCDHTSSRNKNSISYERTPSNVNDITTHIDLMHLNMTTNTIGSTKSRVNEVSNHIACGIMSLMEFAERVEQMNGKPSTILMTNVLTVTHAAIIVFVFTILRIYKRWDDNVNLVMLSRPDIMQGMHAYVGLKNNVEIIGCADPIFESYRIVSSSGDVNLTVYTHSDQIADMCTTAFESPDLILNFVTNVNNTARQNFTFNVCSRINGIMEATACSNPDENTIRITPATKSSEPGSNKFRINIENPNVIAKMRWYNNMIRHMSINGICIDCCVMFRIARPIALVMSNRDVDLDETRLIDTISNFQTTVSTIGMADLMIT